VAKLASPKLIDDRVLKAQSHPIRAHILNILSEGPNSPSRMHRRMADEASLEQVCHHVKVLKKADLIELIDVRYHGGREEHIYRAIERQFFDLEEWLAIDPKLRSPIVTTILRQILEDFSRGAAEGKFTLLPDSHLSRSPLKLDQAGWQEVVDVLEVALDGVLAAHDRSAERTQETGEQLLPARVVIMQFPIGPEDPRERDDADRPER
jgi:DNA-binding transcriptional ArsR family regulator